MMDATLERKEEELILHISAYENLAIAFSGGVDSTYLLAIAAETLQEKVVALTARSPIHAIWEGEAAQKTSLHLGVRHYIVSTRPLELEDFTANTSKRCYFCKKHLFNLFWEKCRELNISNLAHGANLDDNHDYRPGFKAAAELNVQAPLVDVGLTKSEIRQLSRRRNLETWNKPAMACLATRIPYGRQITASRLQMVASAEKILINLGFLGCRVRWHEEIARIEAPVEELPALLESSLRAIIVAEMQKLGFTFVTLDMQGYIHGSMNRLVSDTNFHFKSD